MISFIIFRFGPAGLELPRFKFSQNPIKDVVALGDQISVRCVVFLCPFGKDDNPRQKVFPASGHARQ